MASEPNSNNPFLTNDDSETRGIPEYQPYISPYQSSYEVTFPVPHIPNYNSPYEQNQVPLYSKNNSSISNPPAAHIPDNSFNSYSSNAYVGGGLSTQGDNAYSGEGLTYEEEDDDSSDDEDNTENVTSSAAANPGIETSDPNKLNQFNPGSEKKRRKPSVIRLIFRFVTLLASIGALMFMVGAPLASKKSTPSGANKTAIVFTYIVSSISIIVSSFYIAIYCSRRWFHKNKQPRWLSISIDLVLGISYGCLMVFLIKGFSCKPGSESGWCDFYNTSIFFNVLCFLLYAISFFWDIVGYWRG